ncbi:nitrilase-related carbon-nitrogen hydrolase [Longimicrobium terrae]|uniref:Putative amidohydrolase n=1 Tax=Longimicrobium terrae TaxID=1639882 RepID=A0A841H571_9BACT|nr:putative amidohydrolase [Longimicrobium terrae]MBB6073118.1 putative amidohydrolase [Longimicrobium terrae]NNC30195.1 carbon-nitrogen family hydrolase [Longimicrobium terrae]
MSAPLRVALGEYDTGWHDPAASLARAAEVVARAAEAGARLVALPEMCTTGFTMESAAQAEALTGPSVAALADLARRHAVHLLAGVSTRRATADGEAFFNSALLFGPDGELRAEYRKQRLFGYAGEREAYSAGEGPLVVEVDGVKLAVFICYDLRFPELFRAVSPGVDGIVLIANWPAARRPHWDVLVRARAIENQCYFVAVNRTGSGGGLDYDGGSVAYDPWGDPLPGLLADVDPAEVTRVRDRYPFVTDLRDRAG